MHDFPFTMEYVLRDVCNAELKRDRANGKGEVVVCCPLRSGKTFEVNLYKEYWKCFKGCTDCPVNGKGGLLDLYRLYFHCEDKKEAYRRIMDTMSSNEELVERRKKEKKSPTKVAQIADADALDKTYSALLSELVLSKEHRRDLLKRGLSSKDIDVMGFRSIPQTGLNIIAAHLYHSGCQIEGIPGFYFENQEPRMACFGSGYFIPYRNQGGKIVGLQIRYDVEIKPEMSAEEIHDAKKRRYRWLTSSFKQGGTAAANIPFYGLPGQEVKDVAYATEGGLKAATASSLSGVWFTAIPGVNCFDAWEVLLSYLKEQGVKTLVDAFDSDRATNEQVAANIKKLYEIAADYGFKMQPWDWGTEFKGCDDYLLAQKKKKSRRPTPPRGRVTTANKSL